MKTVFRFFGALYKALATLDKPISMGKFYNHKPKA